MTPPTWAKNATPPRFAEALNRPKLASMSWYENHSPRKIQAGIRARPPSASSAAGPYAGTGSVTLNQAGDGLGPAQAGFFAL